MNRADHAVLKAMRDDDMRIWMSKFNGWSSDSSFGSLAPLGALQNEQFQKEGELSDAIDERYRQCIRQAETAQEVGGSSVGTQILQGGPSAWMSGVGAIPDSAWSTGSGGGLISFTASAAKAIKSEQQAESWNLRLNFAQDLVNFMLTGQAPSADLQSRVWQGVGLTNDLLGETLPPWSMFATTFAINAIRAINSDSMRQLDQAMSNFDAVAIGTHLTERMDTSTRDYLALVNQPVGNLPVGETVSALQGLDGVVQQVAELAQDVAVQITAERRDAEARRRLAAAQIERQRQVPAASQQGGYVPQQVISPPQYQQPVAPSVVPQRRENFEEIMARAQREGSKAFFDANPSYRQ